MYDEGEQPSEELRQFYREAIVWRYLRHPNIVPFHGIDRATCLPHSAALVSDWMHHGTLLDYLAIHTVADRLKLAIDMAEGLRYLHEMNILHGDLKSANILVSKQHKACLTDFGLAEYYSDVFSADYSEAFSVRWAAPERLDPENYGLTSSRASKQSDVYALSMTIWETFTGRTPIHSYAKNIAKVPHSILSGDRPRRPPQATKLGLSDELWALMEACWHADPQSRPDIAAVVACLGYELWRRDEDSVGNAPDEWPLAMDYPL
ncbi:kinase-like protein [Obba rivulosa]|uniref:Kinase-like protein n=1 Tax=Obba rivulosa TaxID=1052685 RepID=A0A8E2AWU8_9APHY|nr:kinase-like protein [Obba rivulosa]